MDHSTKKLYDRSIRTWGLDAQEKLLNAHVLAIGYDAVMSEVLKNVVISGVSKVTIIDTFKNTPIETTEIDSTHIFTPHLKEKVLKSVNSTLEIEVIQNDKLTIDYLNTFTLIICTLPEYSFFELSSKTTTPFVFVTCIGAFGLYYLTNVNNHSNNLLQSIQSNFPVLTARTILQKYITLYNEMETYQPKVLEQQLFKFYENTKELNYLQFGLFYIPVISVVSSLAAQEIINIIGDKPTYTTSITNAFVYDSIENIGNVISTNETDKMAQDTTTHHSISLD
ncbi:Ubiquitin-activating enzyme [Entamoeba marina]